MTTLAITPNWKNKSAKFRGTIAAGEHVAVSITNDDGSGNAFVTSTTNLRLNVIDPATGRLLATFPEPVEEGETPATWGNDTTPLTCTLNLNTVQMLKAVPPAANVPLLFVLDDYESKTLYFKDMCEVTHWPRRVGEEEPTNLDHYHDFVAEMEAAWETYKEGIDADLDAQDASIAALEESKADASDLTDHIGDTENPHSVTKAQLGLDNVDNTSDANKPVSIATAGAIAAAKTYAADLVDAEAEARASAVSALDAAKAAKATTLAGYGITDAKIENGVITLGGSSITPLTSHQSLDAYVNGATYSSEDKKIYLLNGSTVVAYIDATAFVKDGMVSSVEIEDGNLVITFNTDAGQEPITIPLTDIFDPDDYYDKTAVDNLLDNKQDALTFDDAPTEGSNNPVKSGGIWSALWGALAALPTGFTSLYDWCVDQLAGKASAADATLTNKYTDWVVVGNLPSGSTWISSQVWYDPSDDYWKTWLNFNGGEDHVLMKADGTPYTALELTFEGEYDGNELSMTTRRSFRGYQLGSQSDKPLASEAEAEALRTAITAIAPDWTSGASYAQYDVVKYNGAYYYAKTDIVANTAWNANNWGSLANLAALAKLFLPLTGGEMTGALKFGYDTAGFAAIIFTEISDCTSIGSYGVKRADQSVGASWPFRNGTLALIQDIADDFSSSISYGKDSLCSLDSTIYRCINPNGHTGAWVEEDFAVATVEDVLAALRTGKADVSAIPYALVTKTISNNAVTLDDRASNAVTISTTLSPNTLTINFPTAPTGKLRDFAMRLNIAAGVTAPEIAWPQGVTLENNGGEVPEIADGGTGGSSTILYFSETENNGTTAKFLVKGETLTAIAQA